MIELAQISTCLTLFIISWREIISRRREFLEKFRGIEKVTFDEMFLSWMERREQYI
jgi:hypothetical protein